MFGEQENLRDNTAELDMFLPDLEIFHSTDAL